MNAIRQNLKSVFRDSSIHKSSRIYGISSIGSHSIIMENVLLGYPSNRVLDEARQRRLPVEGLSFAGVRIGDNAVIRPGSTIYCDVAAGEGLRTGHNTMVRENTTIGDHVLIGTNTVIDGNARIGSNVSIQSNVYIPTNTVLEDNVFMGPCSVLTNDKYPIRIKSDLRGPVLRKGASIGANSTILPGVEVGEGAMVAAGALVTKNVPPWKLAIGYPAKMVDLPEGLELMNRI